MAHPEALEGLLLSRHDAPRPASGGVPLTAMPLVVPGTFESDERGRRTDLTRDRRTPAVAQAIPLLLRLRILLDDGEAPRPLLGAQVEVEHLDAEGRPNGLRGTQRTGMDGRVLFRTVFPGWRPDLPPQVRLRVRYMLDAHRHAAFASPLFFPDTLADAIYEWRPYRARPAEAARNAQDPVFGSPLAGGGRAGELLTLAPRPSFSGHGYVARRDVVLLATTRGFAYAG